MNLNLRSVFRFLAFIMLFIAAIMLVPMFMAIGYGERRAFTSFAMTVGIMLLASCLTIIITRREKELRIGTKEAMLIVTLTWVLMTAFGALPLYFADSMASYAQCYFEIMSGFTTTGATAMPDIEIIEKSIIFWRGLTNWLGGMGVVVLFVAVLPIFGVKGNALVGAESVGPTKSKLTPTIRHTAMALWGIYIGISAVQVVLLMLGGLNLYHALTVMFGTMGAAGFAPLNASIGGYDSPYIEWVCTIFMMLAGANFSLYFFLLRGHVRKVLRDGELKLYVSIISIFSLLITIQLFSRGIYSTFSESLREAAFHIVSFITTTGFSADDYNVWPIFSQMLILITCFIGGCAGSAGGGIKVVRIGVALRLGYNAMMRRIHPNAVRPVRLGDDLYDSQTSLAIGGFIGCYFVTFFLGAAIISLCDQDFLVTFTSVILCLGNIGIGLGGIGITSTFAIYPDWALWVFSFLMLVGRLELFTVYTLFTRSFWKK